MNDHKKFAYFLPNLFTAFNMACGFAGIIFSLKGDFYKACMAVSLGAVFDSVDGRVARLTGTQSPFGEQFDSLSDLISFGMAPAMIFYNRFLFDMGRPGLILAFLFLLCGALRLARFNANIDKVSSNYFQGLPIPGAASAMIGFILLSTELPLLTQFKTLSVIYILFYSVLMISTIPFPSFKDSPWVKAHKKFVLFILIATFVLIFTREEVMILAVITTYVLSSIIYFAFHRKELKQIFDWHADQNLEDH